VPTKINIFTLCVALFAAAAAAQTPAPLLPNGIAYDANGNLYIVDTARNEVYEATLAGQLLIVAGTGTQGFAGDGGPATLAQLNAPRSLAVGADGTLYIADTGNQRIRAISPQGMMTTIAGSGAAGYSGDNGPAVLAQLHHPAALAIDATGALLLCDTSNHRIRRISSFTITTLAGTGTQGFSGDGGPATQAQLDSPAGIAADAAGNIYLADTHNQRIRLISAAGLITTLAGTGTPGYSGDGGPAIAAQLALPQGLALTASGTLLIADANNQRLRSISNSTITTVAGDGTQGSAADATPSLNAPLNNPRNVAFSAFAQPTLANTLVHTLAANALYTPAALTTPIRVSTINLTLPSNTYGEVTAAISVIGTATPQGTMQLLEGTTPLAKSTLINAATTILLPTLNAGTHTLTASYLGDGLNPAASTTATLSINQSPTLVSAAPPAATYASQSMPLAATVAPTTSGLPTGTVHFFDNTTLIASATLSGGSASAFYLSPATGTHTITAAYLGDTNFLPNTSAAVTAVVQALPDFTLTTNASAQTVVGGSIATYTLAVTPQSGSFSGAVSFSVTGLPANTTATFSPPQLIPGASAGTTTLSVTTPVTRAEYLQTRTVILSSLLLTLFCFNRKRRLPVALLALLPCCSLLGCGNRVATATAQAAQSYSLTVAATSTNALGSLVTHTTTLTLTVQ
jgi:sugar lactone lactonase YvrE